MIRLTYLLYIIFPLVYLDNGGYRGQTPPPMPDNSLTSGEIGMLLVIIAIVLFVIIHSKLNKRK